MLLDSYMDAGVLVAADLVNRMVVRPEGGEDTAVLREVLAVDPPSAEQLAPGHVPGFAALARTLRSVFDDLAGGDEDAAAERLNRLLAAHPAHPHLAKEDGRWRLHHHPGDAPLVPMWTSICAEALARLLAGGHADRVGSCADGRCGRVFVDTSRNASRRFCSTTCQNRVKTAALRRRRAAVPGAEPAGQVPRG
ncbi:CGNR zinc finger domain-containing protein [Actinomadura sp. KC216]|uniref:CGNR zinc finger domain-containing protein n=1 Tax=Actinomadura sp. KC216 TaxID=2530370 RepID=UPI001AA00497|nr:CGNR zinc finger domain-containing protein [Actinomadura sp. KC216]